jgi:pyruvate-ferredoxin/flavodoxin oxidoreductase
VWDAGPCIQCNKCAFVCPRAAIRAKVYPAPAQAGAPASFVSLPFKGKEYGDDAIYTLQVAPDDCTGCSLCVQVCPARDKANPRHKALEARPQAEVASRAARTTRSSSACRESIARA